MQEAANSNQIPGPGYHPEMGEVANPKALFHTEFNYGNSYSCEWLAEHDTEARAILKQLRIRPAFGTSFEPRTPGSKRPPIAHHWMNKPTISCLITSNAEDKLAASGLRCIMMLLD